MALDSTPTDTDRLAHLQSRQQLVVLAVLVTLYAALPVALVLDFLWQIPFGLASSIAAPKIDSDALVQFMVPLASADGSVLEALHKLILPLAALFLGANFAMLRNGRLALWLFLVPLLGTVAALLAASLIDAYGSSAIKGAAGLPMLLRDIASNLGVVLMLLVGQNIGGAR